MARVVKLSKQREATKDKVRTTGTQGRSDYIYGADQNPPYTLAKSLVGLGEYARFVRTEPLQGADSDTFGYGDVLELISVGKL